MVDDDLVRQTLHTMVDDDLVAKTLRKKCVHDDIKRMIRNIEELCNVEHNGHVLRKTPQIHVGSFEILN
jgi:hypothetical protein